MVSMPKGRSRTAKTPSLRASLRPAAIVNPHNVLSSGTEQTIASLQIKEKEGRRLLVTFIVSYTNFERIESFVCFVHISIHISIHTDRLTR